MTIVSMHSSHGTDRLSVLACSCVRGCAVDDVEHHLPGGRGPGPQHQPLLALRWPALLSAAHDMAALTMLCRTERQGMHDLVLKV